MSPQPPDEYFDRPPEKGPPPPARKSTPAWLWLLLIMGFALIFWQFAPRDEVAVSYSPWFLDQVDTDNIQSLTIEGIEVHGVLFVRQAMRPGAAWPGLRFAWIVRRGFPLNFSEPLG
jgi:cell division protease FtsH